MSFPHVMRILLGAPRKSGNAYLRCLLATAYGLTIVNPRETPPSSDSKALSAWFASLPDHCVASTSEPCTVELQTAAAECGIMLLGIVRHPFDLFVSNFDVAQQRAARDKPQTDDRLGWERLAGRSPDDPEVLDYARNGFAEEIAWLHGWQLCAAFAIEYEQLLADPSSVLANVAATLPSLDSADMDRAVRLCQAENTVVSRPARGRRMGELPAGAWRERLPDTVKEALRECFSDDVLRLGYDVN